jgi:hypothetical protein
MTEQGQGLTTADIAQPTGTGAEEETTGDTGAEAATAGNGAAGGQLESLLPAEEGESFRSRWADIQTRFVDAPRESVEQADALVAELMQRLAQTFAQERESLEAQWSGGGDPSTEDLRVGLQRYRSFFERLLST